MTRRVLVGLLALAALLLGAAVLPLGLETAAHYRIDYAEAGVAQARGLASAAEERLSDHDTNPSLQHTLIRYVSLGQGIVLLDAAGTFVDQAGIRFALPPTLAAANTPLTTTVDARGETLMVSAVPISNGTNRVGTVIVARPTEPLEARIRTLWLTLGAVAAVSLLAAVALALWLSRWVTRPLRRLEEAAHTMGGGNLGVRADIAQGPPEVRRLAAALDAMASRLNTLLDGHRAVIADVSHQLRTPMSALRLRLELLPQLASQDHTELNGALHEVNRLSRLIDGLLAVARADATNLIPTPVDTRAVISDRVSAWSPLAAERGVNLSLIPGPFVSAWAVPDHLEQILDNLLGNCFDLDPAPSQVNLSVTSDGDNAILTVVDNGPGMSRAQREQAFQRFATGRADAGGTGLGLAIVHQLINAQGGRIRLEETPGGGLTVELSLPRVRTTRRSATSAKSQ